MGFLRTKDHCVCETTTATNCEFNPWTYEWPTMVRAIDREPILEPATTHTDCLRQDLSNNDMKHLRYLMSDPEIMEYVFPNIGKFF